MAHPVHDSIAGHAGGIGVAEWAVVGVAAAVAAAYLLSANALRRRGVRWLYWRDLVFAGGNIAVAVAWVAPLPGGPFTAHVTQHLIAGMLAPLLLVLGRPVTLILRTLPAGRSRRSIVRLLGSKVVGCLMFPPVAGLLDIGWLWVLYRTSVFSRTEDNHWLHALVHLHMLIAGVLFAAAVCQLDPVRRRWGLPLRAGTLIAVGAAHNVLAKSLFAAPPPGSVVSTADLQLAAQLMYYGGDLIEVALAITIACGWYATTGRVLSHSRRRTHSHTANLTLQEGSGRTDRGITSKSIPM